MFWQSKTFKAKHLVEFKSDTCYCREVVIISYLSPSPACGVRKDVNLKGAIDTPLVLLGVVMPKSFGFYRWPRTGVIKAIERASISQDWESIFQQVSCNLHHEIDRRIFTTLT